MPSDRFGFHVHRNCFSLLLKTLADDTDLISSRKEHRNSHPLNSTERCPKEVVSSW